MNQNMGKCSVCNRREPFFFRPYSGEKLCKKCFTNSVEQKAKATIAKYKMLNYNDRIAIAVSGGKDSVSLLHILTKLERKYPKASLIAVTVDEGIKGYRDEALKIARENCKKLDIEHYVTSFKKLYGYGLDEIVEIARQKRKAELTPCAYCGVLRRKALNMAAKQVNANKIATAHTLDDETQTFLLNIFHGDIWRIAREKPVTDETHPKLVQKVKPFCEIPEKETALYAYLRNVRFQNKPCPYASEALRNDIRNMLNRMEEKHAGMKFTIFKSVERLQPIMEKTMKKEYLQTCSECGEPTAEKTCQTCQMLKQLS